MHEALEQQCYHYDTIITLADGSEKKIGEIVEELLEKNKDKTIQGKDCLILPNEELEVLTTDFKDIFKTGKKGKKITYFTNKRLINKKIIFEKEIWHQIFKQHYVHAKVTADAPHS
jgi:hypothetical protein